MQESWIWALGLVFFISLFLCYLSIGVCNYFGIGLDFKNTHKPQRMHSSNVPRIGGIGIFIGFYIGMLGFYPWNSPKELWILLGLFFVFLGGILEDLFSFLRPMGRLSIQIIGISIMLLSTKGVVFDLSPLIILPFSFAVLFSIFGICGVCNGVNIIDGLNGLSSGICLLVLGAISYVSSQWGLRGLDFEGLKSINIFCYFALSSALGFFVLNFPKGKIFLGDGGSYFLGALIGFLLGWLTEFGISSWLGLAMMIYPVWEALFSILRRKINGKRAMQPDGLHLHSLLAKIKGNSKASFILLIAYAIYLFLVVTLANLPWHYILAILIFILFYTIAYIYLKKYSMLLLHN